LAILRIYFQKKKKRKIKNLEQKSKKWIHKTIISDFAKSV